MVGNDEKLTQNSLGDADVGRNGGVDVGEGDLLIGAMGVTDAAGAEDHFVLEAEQVRGVAAKGNCRCGEAFESHVFRR